MEIVLKVILIVVWFTLVTTAAILIGLLATRSLRTEEQYPPEIYGDSFDRPHVWINRTVGLIALFQLGVLTYIYLTAEDLSFMPLAFFTVFIVASGVVELYYRRQRSYREKIFATGISTVAKVIKKELLGGVTSIRRVPQMKFRYAADGVERETDKVVGGLVFFHLDIGDEVEIRFLPDNDLDFVPILSHNIEKENEQHSGTHPLNDAESPE